MFALLLCVGILAGWWRCAPSWAAGPEGRVLVSSRAEAHPLLDGRLEDPCWRTAAKAGGFVQLESGKPAQLQTTGQVVWDEEHLYIGVWGEEPRMDLVRAAAGKATGKLNYGRGETIELFLAAAGSRQGFLQILVNTDGTWETWTTDAMQLRNLPLKPVVHLGARSFSMEIAIPLAVLHLRPESGQTWGFNLCRARKIEGGDDKLGPDPVYSSWQPTPGGFRQPDRFGDLQVGVEQRRFWLLVQPRFAGSRASLTVANHTGAACDLLVGTNTGRAASQPLTLAAGGTQTVPIPAELTRDQRLDVTLKDRATRQVLYVGGTALKESGAAAAPGPIPAANSPGGMVVFIQSYLERGSQHTVPRAGEVNRPLELFAAPGEYEPATFAVRADHGLKAVAVTMVGGLKGPAGSAIPAGAVTIRTVERMKRWRSPIEYELVECFLPRTGPGDLPARQTRRYWLTVHVPMGARPGLYEGRVRIAPAGGKPHLLPLRLRVAPIRLAPPEGLNTFMYFRIMDLAPELRTERFFLRCLEDMREHGMTTMTLYAYPSGPGWLDLNRDNVGELPMARQVELARATGLLAPWSQVPWIGAECYGSDLWRLVQQNARQKRWPELLFYLVDEPCPGRYERVDACMAAVAEFGKQHPELRFRTTTAGASDPRVSHYYDVWIGAAEKEVARARKEGRAAWDYDCGLAPVDAHTDRYYFGLWAWKLGIAGVSHWAYYDAGMLNRFMVQAPWRNSPEDLTEYTHNFNYVYPTPEELIPTIGWEAVREGIDDFRYLHTLKRTADLARARGASRTVLKPAVSLLDEVSRRIRSEGLRAERARAGKQGMGTRDFERRPPQPEWTPAEYDRLRRRVAGQIAALNRAGFVYRPTWQPPGGTTPLPPGPSFPEATSAPSGSMDGSQTQWEGCDDLAKINTTYAQLCWRPKAFAEFLIGKLEVSETEKAEGKGSLHWLVTRADVDERLRANPGFSQVMLNYLYGRDWSPYTELRLSLKCESPGHPPLYLMLLGARNPYRLILNRNEVTRGWKEVRWNLSEADIGVSERYGKIMNYLRLFSNPADFAEGDVLDLYLDDMRLVTRPAAGG